MLKFEYRISANSFRGNNSFLNLTLCTLNFDHSTYRCGNYSRAETICGSTVSVLILIFFQILKTEKKILLGMIHKLVSSTLTQKFLYWDVITEISVRPFTEISVLNQMKQANICFDQLKEKYKEISDKKFSQFTINILFPGKT